MKIVVMAALIALIFALATPVAVQDYRSGMAAYDRRDDAAAIREWRPPDEHGLIQVHYYRGTLYRHGRSTARDDADAVKWYRQAAEQGIADAQYNLGRLFATGEGVAQDYVQAHIWYSLAARQGHQKATQLRDIVAGRMTPEQLAEAQKLAREWRPK